jgi:hypothetical protein
LVLPDWRHGRVQGLRIFGTNWSDGTKRYYKRANCQADFGPHK